MAPPAILVVTGASGVGKTTLVQALAADRIPGVRCHHFDSIGVPNPDQMIAQFGSPTGWQGAMTHQWITTLSAELEDVTLAVLDGQVRPGVVREAFKHNRVRHGFILLLDCDPEVRDARLCRDRGQPDLATPRMTAWAAYLRGQADALHVPVLDTTSLSPGASAGELRRHVEGLLTMLSNQRMGQSGRDRRLA